MSGTKHLHSGEQAEALACRHLQAQGLSLLQKNYHCAAGEIDLIMREDRILVFVEVRYRRHPGFGSGAESVTRRKQGKIIATANHYLQRHSPAVDGCRFDVISIGGPKQNPDMEWIKNAFTA
jgi:putative endonuclease